MQKQSAYQGTERRVHKVYVTRNTEYHVRRGVCVAVKARKEGAFEQQHGALRMRLEGHVKQGSLLPLPGPPQLGFRIYFANSDTDVLTSQVIAIIRPAKRVVEQYPQEP